MHIYKYTKSERVKFMFDLKKKNSNVVQTVYSVKCVGKRTEFLVYEENLGFVWRDSSYYEPLEKVIN